MADTITLNKDTPSVQYLCKKDRRLAKVINMVGSITYTTHADDPYAFLIHEIIEQMLSVKAGAKIYGRLVDLCNGNITPNAIAGMGEEEIKSIGTSVNKAKCIMALTDAVVNGSLSFDEITALTDDEVIYELTKIKGIGQWTSKMFLIFVLDRTDILPFEDVAFLQSFKWLYKKNDADKAFVKKKCNKWKPYRSIASRYMYRALDMGLTREEFHLYK